jgi:hypothetical protein
VIYHDAVAPVHSMAGFSSTTKPNLPKHYKTELILISPTSVDFPMGPEVLCMLLDEMHKAHELDADENFVNQRVSIVHAYGEGRLYGLRVRWTERMYEKKSFEDPIFMENMCNMVGNLPCFAVIDKPYEDEIPSKCQYLWTAPRARLLGLASYMLNELDVRSVENPANEAFWDKFLTRVQDDIESNTFTS